MENFHVDNKLATFITDDQNSNATAASLEGLFEAGPKIRLIDHGESLLDVACLGHSDD